MTPSATTARSRRHICTGSTPRRCASYAFEAEENEQYAQRPADDDFRADLHRAVVAGQAGVLEGTYLEGASRWHHLTSDTLDPVRAGLLPRARLAVWPLLSSDIAAVLRDLPADGLVEGVWQDEEGLISSAVVDDACPCTAVMTDDGVLRARRRAEPTPSDRDWARRQS
ncbi:hypothetical protein GCM10010103_34440 [Streptomyces paradoxus]